MAHRCSTQMYASSHLNNTNAHGFGITSFWAQSRQRSRFSFQGAGGAAGSGGPARERSDVSYVSCYAIATTKYISGYMSELTTIYVDAAT